MRDVAQDALVQIGPEATDALIAAMQTGHTDAFYAAQAIAQQGMPALDALKKLAADNTHPVGQRWAAVALGDMGVAEAAKPLQDLAKSPDPDVAYVAQAQLARLGQPQAAVDNGSPSRATASITPVGPSSCIWKEGPFLSAEKVLRFRKARGVPTMENEFAQIPL